MDFKHIPVFLEEALQALKLKSDGSYADCTAGGGGHAVRIAQATDGGSLLAIDRDPEAIQVLRKRLSSYPNAKIVEGNFFDFKNILAANGFDGLDGILVDLGVSSHQLDSGERGFSYHKEAKLDMRMDMQGLTAADIVNTWPRKELQRLFYRYGEEKFAPSIAAAIVKQRQIKEIKTTFDLVEIIKSAIPAAARREGGHPARKTFQALRIEVNGELERLEQALRDMFESLKPGGRLVVISFHSLEDRIVKNAFKDFCGGCTCPKEFPVCVCGRKPEAFLPFKVIKPSEEELISNPRSRSAKLRAVEKQ